MFLGEPRAHSDRILQQACDPIKVLKTQSNADKQPALDEGIGEIVRISDRGRLVKSVLDICILKARSAMTPYLLFKQNRCRGDEKLKRSGQVDMTLDYRPIDIGKEERRRREKKDEEEEEKEEICGCR
ncbi:Hypothetical predicted protein [Octopus vulgaris]|uniref:Uncharacterized protein n=1 Tax=Octopus vulgaris TaxID=6645 RepID=A0AA36AK49_OCTVU|nr:Hypothetical predicted protein [Octopus vulgaris]